MNKVVFLSLAASLLLFLVDTLSAQETVSPPPTDVEQSTPPRPEPTPEQLQRIAEIRSQLRPEQLERLDAFRDQLQNDLWSRLRDRGVDVAQLHDLLNDTSPAAMRIKMRMRENDMPVDEMRRELNLSYQNRIGFGKLLRDSGVIPPDENRDKLDVSDVVSRWPDLEKPGLRLGVAKHAMQGERDAAGQGRLMNARIEKTISTRTQSLERTGDRLDSLGDLAQRLQVINRKKGEPRGRSPKLERIATRLEK